MSDDEEQTLREVLAERNNRIAFERECMAEYNPGCPAQIRAIARLKKLESRAEALYLLLYERHDEP